MKTLSAVGLLLIVLVHSQFNCEMREALSTTLRNDHSKLQVAYPSHASRSEGHDQKGSDEWKNSSRGLEKLTDQEVRLNVSARLFTSRKPLKQYRAERPDVDAETMGRMIGIIDATGTRGIFPVEYHNPKLGTVQWEHPVRQSTGMYPEDDVEIGTMFILQQASRCPGRRRHIACTHQMYIHYDNISTSVDSIPKCDVLTVTIHGFNSENLSEIDDPLTQYHFPKHRVSCNLMVNWKKGAAMWVSLYFQPGRER